MLNTGCYGDVNSVPWSFSTELNKLTRTCDICHFPAFQTHVKVHSLGRTCGSSPQGNCWTRHCSQCVLLMQTEEARLITIETGADMGHQHQQLWVWADVSAFHVTSFTSSEMIHNHLIMTKYVCFLHSMQPSETFAIRGTSPPSPPFFLGHI